MTQLEIRTVSYLMDVYYVTSLVVVDETGVQVREREVVEVS
jgi:hypothetical protein